MATELTRAIKRYTDAQKGESPFITAIDGVIVLRMEGKERRPRHVIMRPALCVVAQGAKYTTFGNRRFEYSPGRALVVSVEMPALGAVTEASPAEPFLGVVIELDAGVMRDVMSGLDEPPAPVDARGHGVCVADFSGPLEGCVVRAIQLLATPRAIPTLYPAIMREICYWLLTGPSGGEIASMTLKGGHAQQVVKAIHQLRKRFAEPVRIAELARAARMSTSAFHRAFKSLTSMTPLQYQKKFRLMEARQLILSSPINVESAAFEVGYRSASQFNREYSRMFGAPPRRDVVRFKRSAVP
ncbi:MAG: AraC family transcriptional regulator [Vicinamibacteria bacterium]|nr:AraC family transcriptional regulator [Vicinamibacteria bacterium]